MKELFIIMAGLSVLAMVAVVPATIVMSVIYGGRVPMVSICASLVYSVIAMRFFKCTARFFIEQANEI